MSWYRTMRTRAAERQGWKCYWCGLPMCSTPDCPLQCTLEHLTPRHNGGTSRHDNVVAACKRCNNERHPEINRLPRSDSLLVATTGDTDSPSPFEVLKGR